MGRKKAHVGKSLLSHWSIILVVVFVLFGACMALFDELGFFGFKEKAHSCTKDEMTAAVSTDGSVHVVDSRTYKFKGKYTLTAAVLDPPDNGEAIVNSVSVIDGNGNRSTLEEVPFQTGWRTSGGPSSGHYAIDKAQNTVYAFSTTEDADKTFVFDYTYTNAVTKYNDVSVLYWQFIGPKWDVDTKNTTVTLTLPVPEGESVKGGENVYAFGHGPLEGNVTFNADNTITFNIPKVKSGTFAEMRVAFPNAWTPSIMPSNIVNANGLQGVLDEEKKWQDEAAAQRIKNALILYVPLGISLLCLLFSLVLFLRHGKEYKPQSPLDYWRDVPDKGTHPAVIARLWRWNEEDANDITTTLMHLSNLGVVRIEQREELVDRKVLPDKQKTSYHLILDPEKRGALELDPIDEAALSLVFDKVGGHSVDVSLDDLTKYSKDHAESFVKAVDSWQGKIDKVVDKRNFFEKKGDSLKTSMHIVAFLLAGGGFFISSWIGNYAPFLGLLPGVIILAVFAHFMPRRSREAVEIQERNEALKRWLKDFTALNEAVPTDAKVWGELLVYAYIFGVVDEAVTNLNAVAPEIWNDPYFSYGMLWYYNPYGAMYRTASNHDFFGNAFENTYSTAQAAVSAASGGGGGSFGGGGGFSGGGGGGFGGGGGGFSR